MCTSLLTSFADFPRHGLWSFPFQGIQQGLLRSLKHAAKCMFKKHFLVISSKWGMAAKNIPSSMRFSVPTIQEGSFLFLDHGFVPYGECLGSFFGHFNSEILSKQWTRKVIDWVLPCFWSVPIARNLFSHMIYPSKTVWAVALLVFVHIDTLILKFVVLISKVALCLTIYKRLFGCLRQAKTCTNMKTLPCFCDDLYTARIR